MKCSICPSKKDGEKLLGGWKRKGEQTFCPECWRKLYHIRAVTFPVASVVEGPGDNATERWKALRAALSNCWQNSTSLANWAVTELAKRDAVRLPDMEKLPKMPPNKKGSPSSYLYKQFEANKPLAVECFPEMDTGSIIAILNTVQAKYKSERFDVIWRRERSLPTFRYPYPYPIPAQGWAPHWLSDTEKAACISVTLNRQRFTLRLRGGRGFRRQLASFAALIAGDAVGCEMAIYRVRAAQNDNRIGVKEKTDGATVHYNIMCKLVMWLPKEIVKREPKTLAIATDKASFLIASFDGSEVWRINADHVRQWIARYDTRRHRLSDDLKAELRGGGVDRFANLRAKLAKHQGDRLNTFIHQSARQTSNYALRNKCSEVFLNDDCREYLPAFPWDRFKTELATKLNEANIKFTEWSDRQDKGGTSSEAKASGSEPSKNSEAGTEA